MKLKNVTYIAAIFLSLVSQTVLAENNSITYKNGRGSLLTLKFSSDYTVTGSFTNAVASKSCQQSVGMKRPIQGFTADNAITIIVNYPGCGAVVTFIGNMDSSKKIIDTTALVAYQSSQDGLGPLMVTHDVFKQV